MIKKIFKNWRKFFLKEISLHIVACGILSFLDPAHILAIFLLGLGPDLIALIRKILDEEGLSILRRKQAMFLKHSSQILHAIVFAISIIAIFQGYPYIGIAGISHIILDLLGF